VLDRREVSLGTTRLVIRKPPQARVSQQYAGPITNDLLDEHAGEV
jgi:hypothetical protein